jgi:hypothetical protein
MRLCDWLLLWLLSPSLMLRLLSLEVVDVMLLYIQHSVFSFVAVAVPFVETFLLMLLLSPPPRMLLLHL